MTPTETAAALAMPVGRVGGGFMSYPDTYRQGEEMGTPGLDFYIVGRAGFFGEADADIAVAALVFFEPAFVSTHWNAVAPERRRQIPSAWALAAHRWAETQFGDAKGLTRIAELAGRVVAAAASSGAPLFAGWRGLEPPTSPKALVVHHLNGLRELRGALHAGAILAAGITPKQAVLIRQRARIEQFGWAPPYPDVTVVRERWEEAEAGTNRAMANIFAVLSEEERTELAQLTTALVH